MFSSYRLCVVCVTQLPMLEIMDLNRGTKPISRDNKIITKNGNAHEIDASEKQHNDKDIDGYKLIYQLLI